MGQIESSVIGRLKQLRYLDLAKNWIEGQDPEVVSGLVNLEYIDLSENNFDTCMNKKQIDVSNWVNLCVFNITNNK